jgi:hypothetical protein
LLNFYPEIQNDEQTIITLVEGGFEPKLEYYGISNNLEKQEDFKSQYEWSH